MPLFDLPLHELEHHRTSAVEPPGLDTFWANAIASARAQATDAVVVPYGAHAYGSLAVFDVTFSGADGDPVKAWYLRPRSAGTAQLACRVGFIGYGGGREQPSAHALYPAAGHATLIMDSRGQGGSGSAGHTPDPGAGASGPEHPGMMTRGLASPSTYYYRRLYVDAVRAVETAADLPGVDPERIAVGGASQGGGLALAAAALAPDLVRLCCADVPFLCDIERGMDLASDPPYTELVAFLAVHPELEAQAQATLRHVDNALLATRIRARTIVSVALRDSICPPSTVFAAYNAITAEKEIAVLPYSGHTTTSAHDESALSAFQRELG